MYIHVMSRLAAYSSRQFGQTCTCFNLRKAARILTRRYDQALVPVGLKATQFSVLASLYGMGPVSIGTTAERLGMERTTLTRNLRPLERQGLIGISVDPDDRRGRDVALTAAGEARLEQALPLWEQAQTETLSRLGDNGWQELSSRLRRIEAPAG